MIYRLIFEKMPDENTNPVWTTQTSQNDQTTTNSSWDDFVLDFWWNESDESIWTAEVETSSIEDNTNWDDEDIQDSGDLDFGDGDLDKEEWYGEVKEDYAEIQEENMGDDMNIDISSKDGEDYIDVQEENMDDDMNTDISSEDNTSDTSYEVDDEIWWENEESREGENKVENEDTEYWDVDDSINQQDFENQKTSDNNEENLDTDLSYPENVSINKNDDIDNNEETNEDYAETEYWNIGEESDEPDISSEIDFDTDLSNNNEKDEYGKETQEDTNVDDSYQESADSTDPTEYGDTESSEEWEDASKTLDDWKIFENSDKEEMSDSYENDNSQEPNLLDNIEEITEDSQNNTTIFGSSDGTFLDTNDEIAWWNTESIFQENSLEKGEENKNIDINVNNFENEETSSQIENTNFLWDTSANSEETNIEDDVDTNITNFELDVDSTDNQEKANVTLDNNGWEDSNIWAEQENNMENNQENLSFTLDYQEDDKQNDNSNHIILDNNSTWNNDEQNWNEGKEIDTNPVTNPVSNNESSYDTIEHETIKTESANSWNQNVTESVNLDVGKGVINQPETHQITSTLSLDQILDSELNDNPQFADNSQAIPRNVPLNSWSLVKKVVWTFAWIGIFALAWYFLLIKSPNIIGDTQQKPTEVIEDLDETSDDHFSWSEDEGELTEENTSDEDFFPTKTTIEQGSMEEDPGDEELLDDILKNQNTESQDTWKPEPYVCEDEYCGDEPEFPDIETTPERQPWDVLQIISDYKQQAESYYTQWDEMQDKKLVKYSLQVMHQCDVYQEQVENWEWLDDESFSSFTSKIDWLFAKIEEYRAWNSIEDENYDFEWKEEVKDFIENRDSYRSV